MGAETTRRTFSAAVQRAARGMTKPERRAYLRARGWTRTGNDDWLPPGPVPGRSPARGYSCYSLAAAVRVALAGEEDT